MIALNDGFPSYQQPDRSDLLGRRRRHRPRDRRRRPRLVRWRVRLRDQLGRVPLVVPDRGGAWHLRVGAALAGGGADVIQAYPDTHGGASPTPAMIKDIIDGTATDLGRSPSDLQGSGMLNIYRAVVAAQQMPGTTDPNGPPADSRGLIPRRRSSTSPAPRAPRPTQSVTLYNTSTSPTTVTGTWRYAGSAVPDRPDGHRAFSAPPSARPCRRRAPRPLPRLRSPFRQVWTGIELTMITPDPTNNTICSPAVQPERRVRTGVL